MLHLPRVSRRMIPVTALVALLATGGAHAVLADTPTPTPPGAAATTAPATTPSATTTPSQRPGPGPKGNFPGGFPGSRGRFGDPTARASALIDRAKSDLANAQGKMDTTQVQAWLNQAATALSAAQSAQSSNKTFEARADAGAAQELALAAETQIRAKTGTTPTPSATPTNRPTGSNGTPTIPPQARTSRALAGTYRALIEERDSLQASNPGGNWSSILSDAEGFYKDAYSAYNASNYDQASVDARIAGHLGRAVGLAVSATKDPTQPVTVPAPNF